MTKEKLDIFGRKLEIGSLVVVKATGRDSSGLKAGVVINDQAQVLIYGPKDRKTSNDLPLKYNEYFLIENPTENEKKLASEVLEIYNNKSALLSLKMKDMQHLHAYRNKNANRFIFFENISFDLCLSFDDSIIHSFKLKNHFLDLHIGQDWFELKEICKKRKSMPTVYTCDGVVTEKEVISILCDKHAYVRKEKSDRNHITLYSDLDLKESEGIIISPRVLYESYKNTLNFKDSPYFSMRESYYFKDIGQNYTADFYFSNVQIWRN